MFACLLGCRGKPPFASPPRTREWGAHTAISTALRRTRLWCGCLCDLRLASYVKNAVTCVTRRSRSLDGTCDEAPSSSNAHRFLLSARVHVGLVHNNHTLFALTPRIPPQQTHTAARLKPPTQSRTHAHPSTLTHTPTRAVRVRTHRRLPLTHLPRSAAQAPAAHATGRRPTTRHGRGRSEQRRLAGHRHALQRGLMRPAGLPALHLRLLPAGILPGTPLVRGACVPQGRQQGDRGHRVPAVRKGGAAGARTGRQPRV